jgi:hypothetical protein
MDKELGSLVRVSGVVLDEGVLDLNAFLVRREAGSMKRIFMSVFEVETGHVDALAQLESGQLD